MTVEAAERRKPRTARFISSRASHVVTCAAPGMSLRDAARLMLEHRVGGLPVLDGATIVGIITESDIFRRFVELQDNA